MASTFDLRGLGVCDFRLSPIPVAPGSFPGRSGDEKIKNGLSAMTMFVMRRPSFHRGVS